MVRPSLALNYFRGRHPPGLFHCVKELKIMEDLVKRIDPAKIGQVRDFIFIPEKFTGLTVEVSFSCSPSITSHLKS